jgi:hypothetical protein
MGGYVRSHWMGPARSPLNIRTKLPMYGISPPSESDYMAHLILEPDHFTVRGHYISWTSIL